MKNTLQRYVLFEKMQGFCQKKCIYVRKINLSKAFLLQNVSIFDGKIQNCNVPVTPINYFFP